MLGFVAGQVAMRLPVKAEVWIGSKISAGFQDRSNTHLAYFLATHPHPEDRLHSLNTLIRKNGYPVRAAIPVKGHGKK